MKRSQIFAPRILAGSISLVLAAPLLAGTAVLNTGEGDAATFEYNDTMLRIGVGETGAYSVVRDGTIYGVTNENGQAMVVDAGSMMRGFAGAAGIAANMAPSDLNGELISMDNTGRKETVAGIPGEVYLLRFTDENGQEQQEEMVLSKDRRALEFRDAMFLMLEVMSKLTQADSGAASTMESSEKIQARLASMNSGVLRYGQEMTVTSLDSKAVDPARFELPAEPLNFEGLGSMLGGMSAGGSDATDDSGSSEKKPGMFSSMMGALGEKVNRQTDRQAERVGASAEEAEREIDAETDEKVDNAIGKAFGKLFGRN